MGNWGTGLCVMVGGGSPRPRLSGRAVWKEMWYRVPFVPGPGLLHAKLKSWSQLLLWSSESSCLLGSLDGARGVWMGCYLLKLAAAGHQTITSCCPDACDPIFHKSENPGESDTELVAHVPLCWLAAGLLLALHALFVRFALCCLTAAIWLHFIPMGTFFRLNSPSAGGGSF